ncbi:MAG: beta-lactamase family protein [Trueperaceae bacterium]|nr:beta-lactamase family protein [Trueperaceae bacterium]
MNRTRPLLARMLLCMLAAVTVSTALAQNDTTPAGTWEGFIELPGTMLGVSVTLSLDTTGWSGSIDIPAQGAYGMPLEGVSVWGADVTFAIAGVPGAPKFTGTLSEDTIQGAFSQSGQQFPFSLERSTAEGTSPAAQTLFTDAAGRYTVQIPGGWAVADEGGVVTVTSPEGGMQVHFVVVPAGDPSPAVSEAWSLVEGAPDNDPIQALEPPSAAGIDHTVLYNYDTGTPTVLHQALAQTVGENLYLMLITADMLEAQRRGAQLQVVASSFTITAVEQVDLTGVTPRRVGEVTAELEEFIEYAMTGYGIPGAAVAIVQDGEVVYSRAFGVADAVSGEPLTTSTQMMIGSTGKTLTSMLIAQLVDEGVITWDTPVVQVLPQFAVGDETLTQTITFRNLLCACTGVPRRDFELLFNANELTAEGIIESLATFEFFTGFGEAFQYSNQLVATSGYAAAAALGAEYGTLQDEYARVLGERLLTPIGMVDTTLDFEEVITAGRHAVPHQQSLESGVYEPIDLGNEQMLSPVAPAGAHWSTVSDMARYLQTVMARGVTQDGQRVVSEENLLVTWEPQVPVSATESYGLGWMVGEYKGLPWIYHGGNTIGFTSEFTFLPSADVGIVVLTNAQASNAFNGAVEVRLFELLFDQPAEAAAQTEYGLNLAQAALDDVRARLLASTPAEEGEPFLGTYFNAALGTITLEWEGEQLIIDAGEFRAQVRPFLSHAGEFETYITYGGAMTGLPVELRVGDGGEAFVVISVGAEEYVFGRVE